MNSHEGQLEVGARSETGYVRDENQDRMSGAQVPLGHLYIVADGMGGHKGGAVAAELTVQGLQQDTGEARENISAEEVLRAAFKKTNETVYQKAHSGDPAIEGMGSTAVLLLISRQVAWVAHVGDSRAYLYRNGQLKQLTTDHTLVQKMVQAGMLKPEEALDHPNASVLDRAIGNKPSVEVDISDKLSLSEGDAFLLCSDGLSGYVTDPEIEAVLHSQATVQEIPERLVQLALQKGGEDNVTVQFIQYGPRKEAQARRTKKLKKPPPARARQAQRPLLRMAAAFVVGGAIVAVGLYEYWPAAKLMLGMTRPRQELEAANTAKTNAENDVKTLQEELGTVKAAKAKADEDVKELQGKLKAADATRIKAESDGKKLQGELETAKAAKAKADDDVKKLQRELKTAEAAKTEAENAAKKAQEELAAAVQELRKLKEEPKKVEEQKVSKPAGSEEATQSQAPEESTAPLPETDSTKQ
ncbi:MAG TPA: Stp1/IreP family PP2C-type Ser/Thr phosphatase [Candidatus Binatia bacterium]|nr:Stp1/IreP family PP2C-type Ser/Thr phosphatase [Candidatus Binatia bacterium]